MQSRETSTTDGPTIQIICLGDSGGPFENNITGLLVRATSAQWSKGSVLAVDAGSHLASITNILGKQFPMVAPRRSPRLSLHDSAHISSQIRPVSSVGTILKQGPFAGLLLPGNSARANAVHILQNYISTYLITHAHLDHLSGFVINTAALDGKSRPKIVAGFPFTIDAIKAHIFNDIIWPNLTDEEGGTGLVTFQRLVEGGNPELGDDDAKGYAEICKDLSVRGFIISHGEYATKPTKEPVQRSSLQDVGKDAACPLHQPSRAAVATDIEGRKDVGAENQPTTSADFPEAEIYVHTSHRANCVVDSSAFFVRARSSGQEVLIFGDVEPDSLSKMPRNHGIWVEAASKILDGCLAGIFIECSYPDSRPDALLFGHMAPRYIVEELSSLAMVVIDKCARLASGQTCGKKRKLMLSSEEADERYVARQELLNDVEDKQHKSTAESADLRTRWPITHLLNSPLTGLRIVVIHVKQELDDEGSIGDIILAELEAHEAELKKHGNGLGCKFEISKAGESYWF